ncbi:heme ABC transporter ATP-binding protein [Halosegnis longus]|uniref:Cobalamin import ATP-binding protein BtuD n=1 Tax=Halosegnis longus TaxID=2216012 RepID=A0AAJ4UWB3_9EURY|nr:MULTISPECIES: heme ABC transporter ATP-binding protein [Halobacteriales]RNJ26902.1 heme ABC transporter ATP-binding protein [Salella cibi]
MIEIDGLCVDRGGVRVLEDVSLSVADGEFVALVGPNGAGKSTLLGAVGGHLSPAAGSVAVDGDEVGSLSARALARRVATVPQETNFGFDFSVRDVVAMGRHPYRSRFGGDDPDGAAAVERALDRTQTAQFADRSVASLSGGEKQRVLLARALTQAAPTLLLDEPTASLDINHQVRTLDLVAGLEETVVAAIHDLDLAARYCDRVVLLADGERQAVGTPREVFTADRLERVFGVDVTVGENPATGTVTVTPTAGVSLGDESV